MGKMRARPPAQRKGTRSEKSRRECGGGERSVLTIVGDKKSEPVGPLSISFQVGLVVECVAGWLSG